MLVSNMVLIWLIWWCFVIVISNSIESKFLVNVVIDMFKLKFVLVRVIKYIILNEVFEEILNK